MRSVLVFIAVDVAGLLLYLIAITTLRWEGWTVLVGGLAFGFCWHEVALLAARVPRSDL